MARAEVPGRLSWQLGRVCELREETPTVRSIVLEVPEWQGHLAGQHVSVRLTAPDGYQAQRSYSIASAPEDARLMLTVQLLQEGEVSPYLHGEVILGDELELRGPIGRYFVWAGDSPNPLLMVAGGSGVVPFRAMLRHAVTLPQAPRVRLLYSARSPADLIYRDELSMLAGGGSPAGGGSLDVSYALTREWPADWCGHRGRIDRAMLAELAWQPALEPDIYICGPNAFVEAMGAALVAQGHAPARIRTERFGPTGD